MCVICFGSCLAHSKLSVSSVLVLLPVAPNACYESGYKNYQEHKLQASLVLDWGCWGQQGIAIQPGCSSLRFLPLLRGHLLLPLLHHHFCWEAQYKIAGWRKSLGKWRKARSIPALCQNTNTHPFPVLGPPRTQKIETSQFQGRD